MNTSQKNTVLSRGFASKSRGFVPLKPPTSLTFELEMNSPGSYHRKNKYYLLAEVELL